MPAGRKPMSIDEQVDRLEGSPVAKARLRAILANLAGELSVADACAELDLNESWFFDLKREGLKRFAKAMEPGTPGRRPSAEKTPEQEQIAELEGRVRQLELKLKAAELRGELERAGLSRPKRPRQHAAKKARR